MNNDHKIKMLIKKDFKNMTNISQTEKLAAKVLRKVRFKNSKKAIAITLISLIGAAIFSYSLALLLN